MASEPRPLEFRLSPEASKRINEKIICGQLSILSGIDREENKLDRLGRIVNKATEILEKNGQSTKGCSDEEAVTAWLDRKRGKEYRVFKVLCEAVEEDWLKVFDRSIYAEILDGEQKNSLEFLTNIFFETFAFSSEQKRLVFEKYRTQIGQVIGFEEIELSTIIDLVDTFTEEFAHNGRQIRFQVIASSTPCPITAVKFTGDNQNNNLSERSFNYTQPYPCMAETKDWWWQKYVNIEFKFVKGEQQLNRSCTVFVPKRGYIWANILFNADSNVCDVE